MIRVWHARAPYSPYAPTAIASALRDAGYNVRTTAVGDAPVLVIDVQIKKFWAWLNPGFWAITVNTDIATDMKFSTDANSTEVSVHVEDFDPDGVRDERTTSTRRCRNIAVKSPGSCLSRSSAAVGSMP